MTAVHVQNLLLTVVCVLLFLSVFRGDRTVPGPATAEIDVEAITSRLDRIAAQLEGPASPGASAAMPATAQRTELEPEALDEVLSDFEQRMARLVGSVGGAQAGARPMLRRDAPQNHRAWIEFRDSLADRRSPDTKEERSRFNLMTYADVLATFGAPDEIHATENGAVMWMYDHTDGVGPQERYEFMLQFIDGYVTHVF
jgi:hypothetical protein